MANLITNKVVYSPEMYEITKQITSGDLDNWWFYINGDINCVFYHINKNTTSREAISKISSWEYNDITKLTSDGIAITSKYSDHVFFQLSDDNMESQIEKRLSSLNVNSNCGITYLDDHISEIDIHIMSGINPDILDSSSSIISESLLEITEFDPTQDQVTPSKSEFIYDCSVSINDSNSLGFKILKYSKSWVNILLKYKIGEDPVIYQNIYNIKSDFLPKGIDNSILLYDGNYKYSGLSISNISIHIQ